MQSYADNQSEDKNKRSAASVVEQGRSAQTSQFVDNRSSTIAQRQLVDAINHSPKQVAQREQLDAQFGDAAKLEPVEESELQMKAMSGVVQRAGSGDDELLQGQFSAEPVQKQPEVAPNNTGLPDNLKSGIENLSGYSMDDVKVHYNSDKPSQLQAHAYAQGADIHIASGQEKHLPHEAWHVVQQKQGRVKPTMQMKGKVNVNDDAGLEKEADVMGLKALQRAPDKMRQQKSILSSKTVAASQWGDTYNHVQKSKECKSSENVMQRETKITHTEGTLKFNDTDYTVGKKMEATLDPLDPVRGTATGPQWKWMRQVRHSYQDANVVRGHLLNHDLGGFSIPANLYPISTQANVKHSSDVEQPVKKMLNKAAKDAENGAVHDIGNNNGSKDHGGPKIMELDSSNSDNDNNDSLIDSGGSEIMELGGSDFDNESNDKYNVTYNVEVIELDPLEKIVFKCHANYKGTEFTKGILSDLGEDKGGFGGGKKAILPHPKWAHGKRRGWEDGSWNKYTANNKIEIKDADGGVVNDRKKPGEVDTSSYKNNTFNFTSDQEIVYSKYQDSIGGEGDVVNKSLKDRYKDQKPEEIDIDEFEDELIAIVQKLACTSDFKETSKRKYEVDSNYGLRNQLEGVGKSKQKNDTKSKAIINSQTQKNHK